METPLQKEINDLLSEALWRLNDMQHPGYTETDSGNEYDLMDGLIDGIKGIQAKAFKG